VRVTFLVLVTQNLEKEMTLLRLAISEITVAGKGQKVASD
jgi:hypothetical protein